MTPTVAMVRALGCLRRAPLQRLGGHWQGARRRYTRDTVAALERRGWAVLFDPAGMAFPTAEGERVHARLVGVPLAGGSKAGAGRGGAR